jgi:glycosyltransferase involved in cell wall biosynthesis
MSSKVTWLLPVKDGMPYLPETLASIESQTYRNWQVLAWDNGSTDGTVAELHKWMPSRLPGKVIDYEQLSLANSLAKLVETAEIEFCARIDADDINYPERLGAC